jgi:prepilin-type N-terminal cleavage/methylation domain-containing protein
MMMRYAKNAGSKSGFTLVEVIVSLAIFGILMVAFLSVFSSALVLTLRAGHNDQTVAEVSGEVDRSLAANTNVDPSIVDHTNATITVTFPDAAPETVTADKYEGQKMTADGEQVTIDSYETQPTPSETESP